MKGEDSLYGRGLQRCLRGQVGASLFDKKKRGAFEISAQSLQRNQREKLFLSNLKHLNNIYLAMSV